MPDDHMKTLYADLDRMPSKLPNLDDMDRQLYTNAIRHLNDVGEFESLRMRLRSAGGFRPAPDAVEAMAVEISGREYMPSYVSRSVENIRIEYEREAAAAANRYAVGGIEEGEALGLPPLLPGETPRLRALRLVKALAARTATFGGARRYSFTPFEFRSVHAGDVDPLRDVPIADRHDLINRAIAEQARRCNNQHPRAIRELAGRMWRDGLKAADEATEGDEEPELLAA